MSARTIFRSASGCLIAFFIVVYFGPLPAHSGGLPASPAETALLDGRIRDAVALLQASLARSNSAADHLLLCRAYYAEDLFENALQECQQASEMPSSAAFNRLGRVNRARASRVNSLYAFALARKVNYSFERAHVLGEQATPVSAAAEHRIPALIARKNKDSAEREYLACVASASPSELANANHNLAQFYTHTRPTGQALRAVHAAIDTATSRNRTLVDAASILTALHRETDFAIRCLREYFIPPARTDAAPGFKARLQLADLFAVHGDQAGAIEQLTAALALAPNFVSAHKLSQAASQSQQVR